MKINNKSNTHMKKTKRLFALFLSIVIIISVCFKTSTFAKYDKEDGEHAKQLAKAKLYYQMMEGCIDAMSSSKPVNASELRNNTVFPSVNHSINVGVWIEEEIQGSGSFVDGQVNCKDLSTGAYVNQFNDAVNAQGTNLYLDSDMLFCDILYETYPGSTSDCKTILKNGKSEKDINYKKEEDALQKRGNAKDILKATFTTIGDAEDPHTFTDLEKYYVYAEAFQEKCEGKGSSATADIYVYDDASGEMKTKQVSFKKGDDFYLSYDDKKNGKMSGCAEIAGYLSDSNNSAVKAAAASASSGKMSEVSKKDNFHADGDDKDEDQCKQNAVTGIAWLLCPVINLVKKAMNWLYERAVEPFLQVDTKIFDTSNKLYETWNYFRTFANTLLIIFLLIIIVSQLTGYGIDNYGIKKSLPKLIVSALLINLSYIICQGAVDLSNLLGYAFFRMFEGMISIPADVVTNSGTGTSVVAGSAILGTVGVAAGLISGGAVFSALGSAIVAALPAMIMGLISGLISILFFFLILGARQGGIIILIAISPIALACYIVPNTKKLFDKWFDLFKKLLFVYPICGLLMGGCALASSVILGSAGGSDTEGNFIYGLVGLIVGVCPFFFIPTIVKGSMNGMANIGNKLSNIGKSLGSKVGGFAGRKVSDSNIYKSGLERAQQKTNDRLDKLKTKGLAGGRIGGLDRRAGKSFEGKKFEDLNEEERRKLLNEDWRAESLAKGKANLAEQKKKRQEGLANVAFASDAAVISGASNAAWAQAAANAAGSKLWNNQAFQIGDKTYVQGEDGNLTNIEDPDDIIDAEDLGLKIGENIDAEELGRRMRQAFADGKLDPDQFGGNNPKITASTYNEMYSKQQARNRSGQLGQMAEYAGRDGTALSRAAIAAGAASSSDDIERTLDYNTEYISTITKGGKTYARGKDGKYHHGDETLSDEEVEEARKNNNIVNATRRRGENAFKDAEGHAIDAGVVADARVNGGIRTRAQIDRMQASMARTGEVFGKSAFAGENPAYLERASAQEAYTGQMNKIKDTKKWNEGTITTVDVNGQQYVFNQKSGRYVHAETGREAVGADLEAVNAAVRDNKVMRYTRNESGQYVDSLGQTLANGAVLENRGYAGQSYGSLKMAEADKARASSAGALTGAFAGIAASQVSDATRVTSEDTGVTQTNNALGGADAAVYNKTLGRNTTVTRNAAAQSAEKQVENIMSTNEGARKVQEIVNGSRVSVDAEPFESAASRIGRTEEQVQAAINRGSTVFQNQFTTETAQNKVGEVVTNADVVEHQMRNARTVKEQEQIAYAEALQDENLRDESSGESLLTIKEDRAKNQAQRRIFTTAAQNMLDEESPSWETIASDVRVKRRNDEIKAREAEIYNDPNHISDSVPAMLERFRERIHDDTRPISEAEIRAYSNVLSKNGEAGQEAVGTILKELSTEDGVPSENQRIIASQIMSNFGSEYKTTARSIHDYARGILSAFPKRQAVQYYAGDDYATNVGSLKAESFVSMNDAEARRFLNALQGENGQSILTEEEAFKLAEKANLALSDSTTKAKLKGNMEGILEQIVQTFDNSERQGIKWAENSVNPPVKTQDSTGSHDGDPVSSQENPAGTTTDGDFNN